jgi:hypothetical protein
MIAASLDAARALLAGRALTPPDKDSPDPLAALLYDRWFHGTTGEARAYPEAAAYRAVALAARPFEPGWSLVAVLEGAPGAIHARRGTTSREVPPLFWAPVAADRLRPAAGDALLLSPWRSAEQGGFWHLWPPVWPARPPRQLSRWYFRIAKGAEPGFAATLAAAAPLDRAWAVKLLCGEHLAGRRDTAVLYAPIAGAAWLDALLAALAPCLAPGEGPPFTEAVAPGICRADDPGTGQSFGQHCCALLAAAARARPEALADPQAWRAAAAARFAAEGLSFDRPWQRQGSGRG